VVGPARSAACATGWRNSAQFARSVFRRAANICAHHGLVLLRTLSAVSLVSLVSLISEKDTPSGLFRAPSGLFRAFWIGFRQDQTNTPISWSVRRILGSPPPNLRLSKAMRAKDARSLAELLTRQSGDYRWPLPLPFARKVHT
jgi:hypothetical protein